jgi:hypothetical protein
MAVLLPAAMISAGAGGALAATASQARSSAAPAWHVVYRQSGLDVLGVAAAGPKSAWAFGFDDKDHGANALLHWNGRRWQNMKYPDQRSFVISQVYALSPGDAWFAGSDGGPQDNDILHWRDGSWSWLQLSAGVEPSTAYVLSDTSIWVNGGIDASGCTFAGLDTLGCSVVSHWNGVDWTSYDIGSVYWVSFAGSSPSDVWATGESYVRQTSKATTFVQEYFRWTGTAWKRAAAAGPRTEFSSLLVVDSPHAVWLTSSSGRTCILRLVASRWDVLPRQPARLWCYALVSDGRSGFWTPKWDPADPLGTQFVHWTGTRFVTTAPFVPDLHGYATGDGFFVTAVPGSSSVWLYGSYEPATGCECHIEAVFAALR